MRIFLISVFFIILPVLILTAGCQNRAESEDAPFTMQKMYNSPASYKEMMDIYKQQFSTWPRPGKRYFVPGRFGRTHVLEWCKEGADTLVLIHGAMGNVMLWGKKCIEQLSDRYHLIAIETMGDNVGLSEPEYWPIARDSLKIWLLELLDTLKIEKANLAGFSFGGWLSLDFAINYPDRIQRLMVIGAAGFAKPKKSFMIRLMFLMLMNSEKSMRKAHAHLHHPEYHPEEDNFVYFRKVFQNCKQATPYPRRFRAEELKKIKAPMAVVIGKDECFYNVNKAESWVIQHIPHSTVQVIENAGHLAHIERPDTVCAIISAFAENTGKRYVSEADK